MEKNMTRLEHEEISGIVKDVRRIRREISAEFGHDLGKFVAHCQKIEKQLRESGEYTFVETQPPTEGFKATKAANAEVAD